MTNPPKNIIEIEPINIDLNILFLYKKLSTRLLPFIFLISFLKYINKAKTLAICRQRGTCVLYTEEFRQYF